MYVMAASGEDHRKQRREMTFGWVGQLLLKYPKSGQKSEVK
jgi:hypothetical protein